MSDNTIPLPVKLQHALTEFEETTCLPLAERVLVVGVSGGADSLALLHALMSIVPAEQITVAHLDHGLRPESAAESAAIRDQAAVWGVSFVGGTAPVAELATAAGQGIEEAGRLARYRFLAGVARERGAAAVLTGHHADDQVETVLMHILRGSGLAGLRGMLPAARLLEDPDIWLLRPLLGAGRAEIEQYCRDHDLRPVEDASNQDTTYFRNRLRHDLIPLLETVSPQIGQHLQHLAATVTADFALLQELSHVAMDELTLDQGPGWILLDRTLWQELPLSIRRSVLRSAHQHCEPAWRDLGFASLEGARAAAEAPRSGQQAHLPGGVIAFVLPEELFLTADPALLPVLAPQVEESVVLPVPGRVNLNEGWVVEATVANARDALTSGDFRDPWTAYVAIESKMPLMIRGRRRGERMQPLGMGGRHTSIKEIMINRKIPAHLRERWPVVVAGDQIVWLVGQLVDERFRVSAMTAYAVRLVCFRGDE
jgi:tRNA(Ile)-lysidine synthase